MPLAGQAKRDYNQLSGSTPEAVERARNRKEIERYKMRKAETYFKFRLRYGVDNDFLISDCSPELIAKAEKTVREATNQPVSLTEQRF